MLDLQVAIRPSRTQIKPNCMPSFKLQSDLTKTSHCNGNQTWLNVNKQATIKPN
jgi:hypothetical protein